MNVKPRIVCLCGSTRFKDEFEKANYDETMRGKIVLSVGVFVRQLPPDTVFPEAQKKMLDELHLEKIKLADEILVISPGNYVGESTRKEIEFARKLKKLVRYRN